MSERSRHIAIGILAFAVALGILFYAAAAAKSIQPTIQAPPRCGNLPLPDDITCFDVPLGHCYVVHSTVMRSGLKTISCVGY